MKEQTGKGVSIVMPAYRAAATLQRSIQSVLAQTYPDWELLILDDSSGDQTPQIAQDWAERDPRIRFYSNERNLGVAATRNRGVALASYPIVAFLDSDDAWTPEKLATQLSVMEQDENCALCFTGSRFVMADGKASGHVLRVPQKVTRRELLRQNVISCSSVMARRQDLLKVPMPDDPMLHEDYAVWLSLLERYPYAVGVDAPMLIYQVSAQSKSGQKLKAAKMQWRTYRHCGVPAWQACRCFASYAARNLRKYAAIYKKT